MQSTRFRVLSSAPRPRARGGWMGALFDFEEEEEDAGGRAGQGRAGRARLELEQEQERLLSQGNTLLPHTPVTQSKRASESAVKE